MEIKYLWGEEGTQMIPHKVFLKYCRITENEGHISRGWKVVNIFFKIFWFLLGVV